METQEKKKKSCSQCKKNIMNGPYVVTLIFSLYMLFAAIYGTIKLYKEFIN